MGKKIRWKAGNSFPVISFIHSEPFYVKFYRHLYPSFDYLYKFTFLEIAIFHTVGKCLGFKGYGSNLLSIYADLWGLGTMLQSFAMIEKENNCPATWHQNVMSFSVFLCIQCNNDIFNWFQINRCYEDVGVFIAPVAVRLCGVDINVLRKEDQGNCWRTLV